MTREQGFKTGEVWQPQAAATVFAMVITKTVDLIRNIVEQLVAEALPKVTWNVA
jgi:hypothetical protein